MPVERHPARYPGEHAILEVRTTDDGLAFYFERVADGVARLVHVETPGGRDLPTRDYDVDRLPRGVRAELADAGIEHVTTERGFGPLVRVGLQGAGAGDEPGRGDTRATTERTK